MNKLILLLIATALISFKTIEPNPVDRIGVQGPLKFNKTEFILWWTDKPSEEYYIQEYLPKDEKVEHFSQLMTIHLFDNEINVEKAVELKVNELEIRKKTDANCNYQVTESPDGKEFIVDFILGESMDGKMTIIEFNAYRYKQIQLTDKSHGILVYAYSKRAYSDDITPFLKNLSGTRTEILNEMIGIELPEIKMAER
jgi:hypothetical protein